jgi:hypothetical protein
VQSFEDAFETPVIVKIDGRGDIPVPLLSQRDYLPWCAELTTETRAREKEMIAPTAKPQERFLMLRNIDKQQATPESIGPLVFTCEGTIRVLEMALRKVGLEGEALNKFIDSRPVKANEYLAVRLCGLYTKDRIWEFYATPEELAELARRNAPQQGQQQTTFGNAADPSAAAQPAQS